MGMQSNNIKNGQLLQIKAGFGTINQNDLVQVGGPGNAAYRVETIDYARLPQASTILQQTQVLPSAANCARTAMVRDMAGNLMIATPGANNQQVAISKYMVTGSLVNTVIIDTTLDAMVSIKLLLLTNGCVACVYGDTANGNVKFVIVDAMLSIVTPATVIGIAYVSGAALYLDAISLSGGGFAVAYGNTQSHVMLATYGNTGAVMQAPIVVQALTGAMTSTAVRLGQLSNGNLVIVMRTTMIPAGTSLVIVTPAGVSVVGNTIMDATATAGLVELSVMNDYLAIAVANGTAISCAIYNSTGNVQGVFYAAPNTNNSLVYAQAKLTHDGVQFWLAYIAQGGGIVVVQMPIAANTTASPPLAVGSIPANASLDVEYITGQLVALICPTQGAASTAIRYVAIGLPDTALGIAIPYLNGPLQPLGSATVTYWPRVVSGGDFTALFAYDQQANPATFLHIVKFAASSIEGIAQTAVAAGTQGTPSSPTTLFINTGPGSYTFNPIAGVPAQAFNHALSSLKGLQGVLFNTGGVFAAPVSNSTPSPVLSATVKLIAGETLQAGDLITLGADNQAYWATDPALPTAPWRPINQATTAYGVSIPSYGFNTTGTTQSSSAGPQTNILAQLTNGNVVLVWQEANAPFTPYFAMFTRLGIAVLPQTAIAAGASSHQLNVCALTGGGFAVVFVNASGNVAVAGFSGAGVLLGTAATTDGVVGMPLSIVALTNGSFAIAYIPNGSGVMKCAVFGPTAAVVAAPFAPSASTTSVSQTSPAIAALTGGGFVAYYANHAAGSLNPTAFTVYSNTGTVVVAQTNTIASFGQQYLNVTGLTGGGFAVAVTETATTAAGMAVAVYNALGVQQGVTQVLDTVADCTSVGLVSSTVSGSVWVMWLSGSNNILRITKISATGILLGSVTPAGTSSTSTAWTLIPDAMDGILAVASMGGNGGAACVGLDTNLHQPVPTYTISSPDTVIGAINGVLYPANDLAVSPYFLLAMSYLYGIQLGLYAEEVQAATFQGVASQSGVAEGTVAVQIAAVAPTPTRLRFSQPYQTAGLRLIGNAAILPNPVNPPRRIN